MGNCLEIPAGTDTIGTTAILTFATNKCGVGMEVNDRPARPQGVMYSSLFAVGTFLLSAPEPQWGFGLDPMWACAKWYV